MTRVGLPATKKIVTIITKGVHRYCYLFANLSYYFPEIDFLREKLVIMIYYSDCISQKGVTVVETIMCLEHAVIEKLGDYSTHYYGTFKGTCTY